MRTIREIFKKRKQDGEVAVEIEVEGDRLTNSFNKSMWFRENDGSLRGNSAEYVMRHPVSRGDFPAVLDNLLSAFKSSGSIIRETTRAGIHVHINVQDMTRIQLATFLCLYAIYEDTLTEYCGESRKGNLFCLRLSDAEALLDSYRQLVSDDKLRRVSGSDWRYSAVNFCSLSKFGSLEFRAMRSTVDGDVINNWVDMLLKLKDYAMTLDGCESLAKTYKAKGPSVLAREVFGINLMKHINVHPPVVQEGFFRIQSVMFEIGDAPIADNKPVVVSEEIQQQIKTSLSLAEAHLRMIRGEA